MDEASAHAMAAVTAAAASAAAAVAKEAAAHATAAGADNGSAASAAAAAAATAKAVAEAVAAAGGIPTSSKTPISGKGFDVPLLGEEKGLHLPAAPVRFDAPTPPSAPVSAPAPASVPPSAPTPALAPVPAPACAAASPPVGGIGKTGNGNTSVAPASEASGGVPHSLAGAKGGIQMQEAEKMLLTTRQEEIPSQPSQPQPSPTWAPVHGGPEETSGSTSMMDIAEDRDEEDNSGLSSKTTPLQSLTSRANGTRAAASEAMDEKSSAVATETKSSAELADSSATPTNETRTLVSTV